MKKLKVTVTAITAGLLIIACTVAFLSALIAAASGQLEFIPLLFSPLAAKCACARLLALCDRIRGSEDLRR